MTSIKPIMYSAKEQEGYIDNLGNNIKDAIGKDADLLLGHPAIYIHVWRSEKDILNGTYSIYIGETNDIIQRTKEHWNAAKIPKDKRKKGNWQHHMIEDVDENGDQVIPTVFFFGHKLFHKSLTLDIENRLIDYCYAMETAHIYNGRTNPQGSYSGDDDLDAIFSMIWKALKKAIPDLFLSETNIQKSAIFKASPNHKLTDDQKKAKQLIIDRTVDAMLTGKTGQLVFVEGEAGTGKTVLTTSTFYEIINNELLQDLNLKCFMLINHEEQRLVYNNIARKIIGDDSIVQNPTSFLKAHSIVNEKEKRYDPDINNIVDIVFVDEAHLLWNANNQAYDKKFLKPQLDEIIKRARVTVIMFDSNQVLHKGQFFTLDYMEQKKALAMSQGPDPENDVSNYYPLRNQLRMNCSIETTKWIDEISKELKICSLKLNANGSDAKGYVVKIFDDPASMHNEILQLAGPENQEVQLARLIGTMDWQYINSSQPQNKKYWEVQIGDWSMPWNEQRYWRDIYEGQNKRERKRYAMLDWAEKPHSRYEVGTTFTIQGFDLAYAGVILGPSVRYDKESKKIWFDERYRTQDYMKGYRTLENGKSINTTSTISQHELRVLMTRGTKGLFIYACDSDLREALKYSLI